MENEKNYFTINIGGVCFTVTMQASDKATNSIDDYIKKLIEKEVLDINGDIA